MKIVTKEEFIKRIEEKWNDDNFILLDYKNMTSPITIKCGYCNEEKTFAKANGFITSSRKYLCSCLNKNNNQTKHKNNISKVQDIIKNDNSINFIDYWYKADTKKNMVQVKCLDCNQTYSKPIGEFLKNYKCPYCKGKQLINTKAVQALIGDDYEVMSEYKDIYTKVLLRHKKCGFVFKILPKNFYKYKLCPHCDKKVSKGEYRITNWLISQSLDFEKEKSFEWQVNKKRKYDFYIPSHNLIIEYNGEQHYRDVPIWHKTAKEQQQIDKEKQQEAEQHGLKYLIIPYTQFKKIETILKTWFNDYS